MEELINLIALQCPVTIGQARMLVTELMLYINNLDEIRRAYDRGGYHGLVFMRNYYVVTERGSVWLP